MNHRLLNCMKLATRAANCAHKLVLNLSTDYLEILLDHGEYM
jgi:hypothetical protein